MVTLLLLICLLWPISALAETYLYHFSPATFGTRGQCTIGSYKVPSVPIFMAAHCEDNSRSGFASTVTMVSPYRGAPVTFELHVMSAASIPTGTFAMRFSAKCGDLEDENIPWGTYAGVVVGFDRQFYIESVRSLPVSPHGVCGKGIPFTWRAVVDEINTTDADSTYILAVYIEFEEFL